MNNDTISLLQECSAGANMAMSAIDQVLEGVGDDFPPEWLDQVERCGATEVPEKVRRHPHWSDLLFGLPEAVLG